MNMAVITTLFLDLCTVLLIERRSATLHQRAGARFPFDITKAAKRRQLVFEAYELGKLSLEDR